jgi:hypothetical protein
VDYCQGNGQSPKLIELIKKENICYPATDLWILRQRKKFLVTGKKPPKQYLLTLFKKFLLEYLHPILIKPNAPDEYKLPEDKTTLKGLFIKRYTNSYSKPKACWFQECLDDFRELNFVKIEGNQVTVIIKELIKTRREKDDDRFFSNFCANKIHKKIEKKHKKKERIQKKAEQTRKDKKMEPLSKYF